MKLIGKKIGMTRIFVESGKEVPVTLVEVKDNRIVGLRTQEKNGYQSVQVGYQYSKKNKKKPLVGSFGKDKVPKLVREFRVSADGESDFKVGSELALDLFEGVPYVDVQGCSIGKGFQGVVRRHNMSGGPSGHGSKFHRRPGSIGNSSYPGKVVKGKKLPGLMGNSMVTVQNLRVAKIDQENSMMLIHGAVPGPKNGIVFIKKAVKKS